MTVEHVTAPTAHPAYREFAQLVREVIAPRAAKVDTTEVPRSHLDALREVGYFSWSVPREFSGRAIPPAVRNAADDLLFGADPSTALAVTQHSGPVGQILGSGNPEALALLPELAAGKRIGGAGFAQIRSWPHKPSTTATKVSGGYHFNGVVRWLSGWGLVDTAWLGAVDEQNSTYVFGIGDLTSPGITAARLHLAAVAGSRTVSLILRDYFIPREYITEVVDIEAWNALDGTVHPNERRRTATPFAAEPPKPPAPGPIGLARAALADALAAHPDEPSLTRLSAEVEHAAVTPLPEPQWRARLDALAVRATTAGLIAGGGQALLADDIAQVRARAALFLQVRGLSPRVRTARFEHI
ncbi:acyl-CoA dehydrogenase family protein [Nocardia jejuensis]|uniref:acyl-CoA dehydrogenase family protein n=1 Tax=Nocardia jejuensis TaxID=328049 RepID=UPI00082FE837|nr:acyl-CoA dehydrogenase family protein [Nocardia jejuensis]